MSLFCFETDERAEAYCMKIAAKMMMLFDIEHVEAIGRMNRQWKNYSWVHQKTSSPGELPSDWVLYHELPEDWAKIIYYEEDCFYWRKDITPEELRPKPYP